MRLNLLLEILIWWIYLTEYQEDFKFRGREIGLRGKILLTFGDNAGNLMGY